MSIYDAVTIIAKTILPSKDLETIQLEDTLFDSDQTIQTLDSPLIQNQPSAMEGLSLSLNRHSILDVNRNQNHAPMSSIRYIGQKKLGEGNFGVVWSATDQDIGRNVAIKTLKFGAEQGKKALLDEIKVAGHLDHPGIPPIYDIGLDSQGRYYFIMKYIQGEPLSEIIDRLKHGDQATHQRFPFERRVDLMIQLLRILKASHQVNMIHRDIKPDNIIIGPSDELMLIDWGIALNLNENNGEGTISGTPLYMAPEQALLQPLSPRSDLYAVGAVFYELMTLQVPVPLNGVKSLYEMIEQIVKFKPVSPDEISNPYQSFMPVQYRDMINQLLEKNPEHRFSSADALLQAIKDANLGHVNVVCMRTKMVNDLNSLMHWVDQNPRKHMMKIMGLLLLSSMTLLSLGTFLGYMLFR